MGEGGFVFPFEKLEVYRLAVDLADAVFELLERLTANRHLRMVGQMESAVSSIAQNIAEGKGRQYKKEFVQFLSIAEGSLNLAAGELLLKWLSSVTLIKRGVYLPSAPSAAASSSG